ncbi:MAG: ferredoxin [Eubacteriales bacterium]
MNKIIDKKTVITNEEKSAEELSINEVYCIGCGLCTKITPEVFYMEKDKAKLKEVENRMKYNELIMRSASKCPTNAIIWNK